jgi:hypothetical protein
MNHAVDALLTLIIWVASYPSVRADRKARAVR